MRIIGLLAILVISQLSTISPAYAETTMFTIDGTDYFYRRSEESQHQFTPKGQENVSSWEDIIIFNVFPEVTDGDKLASAANSILKIYEEAGKVIRAGSLPRTEEAEAEHVIVAVVGTNQWLEAAFVRIKMIEDKGTVIVWSHRIYGGNVGEDMNGWLEGQALNRLTKLLELDSFPALDSLSKS